MIEAPQSFVVRQECEKAAAQNGFRRILGAHAGWASFGSTTAHGTVSLASAGTHGPWYLALDHAGVIEELGLPPDEVPGPGLARYMFESLSSLYTAMHRVYRLAASLPDAPLREFQAQVKDLPKATEAERLVIQRVGQDIFRNGLLAYWGKRCPLTGITDTALLRASHVKPWAMCQSDAERLDVHNGLLLSALWDAAFDRGLVGFTADGTPLFANTLSEVARAALHWSAPMPLTPQLKVQLDWHRQHVFNRPGSSLAPAT